MQAFSSPAVPQADQRVSYPLNGRLEGGVQIEMSRRLATDTTHRLITYTSQYMSTLVVGPWGSARTLRRRNRPLPKPGSPESLDQGIGLILVPLMHVTGLVSGLTSATSTGTRVS